MTTIFFVDLQYCFWLCVSYQKKNEFQPSQASKLKLETDLVANLKIITMISSLTLYLEAYNYDNDFLVDL